MTSLGIEVQLVWFLAGMFFLVAMLYSSVGLGGGSAYTAILTIVGVNYIMIPTISLILNLIVTFIGMINYWRGGYVKFRLIGPFLITSMPMAYLGGSIRLSRTLFLWLLLITLILVVIRIYLGSDLSFRFRLTGRQKVFFSLILGGVLGFVAGTVGIGGGIYLVPLIIMFSLATAKEAAATGAVFIWLNSLAGITARAQWTSIAPADLVPILVLVLLGGFAGSWLGSFKLKPAVIQKTLGIVIIIAIFFIVHKIIKG